MIEIIYPNQQHQSRIEEFFTAINTPEIRSFFSPHEFSVSFARYLCSYSGKDEYYFVVCDGKVIGYGMLRGWDEGYDVPSLGICLRPESSAKGLSNLLMHHLITVARVRGAKKIMLKVKKANFRAIRLYEKMNFILTNLDTDNLKGTLELDRDVFPARRVG